MDKTMIASQLRKLGGKGMDATMPVNPTNMPPKPKEDMKSMMASEMMDMGNRMIEMAKEMMGGQQEEGIDDTGPDEGYE